MPREEAQVPEEEPEPPSGARRQEEPLLGTWLGRAHFVLDAHHTAAGLLDKRHYWLGIPAVILSTLVGTAIFASLQSNPHWSVQILVGLASVSAAVLVSLQTFLRFTERAEKHRIAGVRYGAIMRRLEELIVMPPESSDEMRTAIQDIREQWDKLNEDTPLMLQSAWNDTKRRAKDERSDG